MQEDHEFEDGLGYTYLKKNKTQILKKWQHNIHMLWMVGPFSHETETY